MVKQLGQSLYQMVTSLVYLLLACSDMFLLLAHILRVLYQIVESVLIFVLSACKITLLLLVSSLVIVVRMSAFLFFNLIGVLEAVLTAGCLGQCTDSKCVKCDKNSK